MRPTPLRTARGPVADEIWQLYWLHQIPVREIVRAYGLKGHSGSASEAAGPAYAAGLICSDCHRHIALRSRQELTMQARSPIWRCDECQQARLDRHQGRR